MDFKQLGEDEIKMIKKAGLILLQDEIAEIIPLAISEVNKILPAGAVIFAEGIEAQYVPQLQKALVDLLNKKLG
jgi:hypothetical protein